MISLYQAINQLFNLIELVLIIRILLSWFPNINWYDQPFKILHDITEPMLEPFRRLIPPMGGFDISPIVLFLVLGVLQSIILNFV